MRDRLQFRSAEDDPAVQNAQLFEIANGIGIPTLIQSLSSGPPEPYSVTDALVMLTLLAQVPENRTAILNGGAIPHLIQLLRSGSEREKQIASSVLAVLAHDDDANVMIGNQGGIPPLFEILRMQPDSVAALAMLCKKLHNQQEILNRGGVEVMIDLVRSGTDYQKLHATFALSYLANRGALQIVNGGAIPHLIALMTSGTEMQQKKYALQALAMISHLRPEESHGAIVDAGGIPHLIPLIHESENPTTLQQATIILFNISKFEKGREAMEGGGIIGSLAVVLTSGAAEFTKRLALKTLKLLASNNYSDAVANSSAIPSLVNLLREGTHIEIEMALDIFATLARNNIRNQAEIQHQGGLTMMIQLFKDVSSSHKISASQALTPFIVNLRLHSYEVFREFQEAFGEAGTRLMQAIYADTDEAILEALNILYAVLEERTSFSQISQLLNTVYRHTTIGAWTGREFIQEQMDHSDDPDINRMAYKILEVFSDVPTETLRDDWKNPRIHPPPDLLYHSLSLEPWSFFWTKTQDETKDQRPTNPRWRTRVTWGRRSHAPCATSTSM